MALTVSSKVFGHDDGEGSSNEFDVREYRRVYEVDQTDAGPLADGVAVAIAAQQLMSGDPLPLLGDNYVFSDGSGTVVDLDAFAVGFKWRRPYPKTNKKRWHITVEFGAPPDDAANVGQPDPLLWATNYWVEWTEEQVLIEQARIVESLDHVGRAAGTLGPIINSAGEQTIDPQVKTIYYPVLCCERPYEDLTDIIALNNAYQDTTNSNTFFGAPPRTAKYLLTESGRLQRGGGISYYLGITRVWFRAPTWDKRVLNNGMMHLKKQGGNYIQDPATGAPQLFRHVIRELTYDQNGQAIQGEFVPSPEPANLALDGQVLAKNQAAISLTYRHLNEVNYAGIGIGS